MGDPIALQDLFFGTLAGAAIVVMGAFYALFYALARLNHSRAFMGFARASFLLLGVAVLVLADALKFSGFWLFVAIVMLVGYFFAPRAIWHLCVGTHAKPPMQTPKETTS